MSPFNKSAGSIVTHSFLALELCGSLDAHKHTMENTAPPAQNIHKTSQNTRLGLVQTEINNIKLNISRGCTDNICQLDRERRSACTVDGMWNGWHGSHSKAKAEHFCWLLVAGCKKRIIPFCHLNANFFVCDFWMELQQLFKF